MQRATIRYVLTAVAIVLGMGLAGYAVASTLRSPDPSDLGPSIVFTPSPSASTPPAESPGPGSGDKPSAKPAPDAARSPNRDMLLPLPT